jgi:hypothetical protein
LFAHNSHERIITSSPIVAATGPPHVAVNITSPHSGTIFNSPASLVVAANATITGGAIQRVEFYFDSVLIDVDASHPYAVTWNTPPPGGFYRLTAVVVDQSQASTTSAPVLVAIADTGSPFGMLGPPTATPGSGVFGSPFQVQLIAAPGATIRYTLDGSTPSSSSPIFAEPLTVNGFTFLQAIAQQEGWTDSTISQLFYDIDTVAPFAVSSTPLDGSQHVNLGAAISVTFSEPMQAASVTAAALELRDLEGQIVPAGVSYEENSGTAYVRPVQLLALGATYQVTLRGGSGPNVAVDLVGNRVAIPHSWSFTTQASVQPPTISLPTEIRVRSSTIVTLSPEDGDSQELPLTYTWTQLAGPQVTRDRAVARRCVQRTSNGLR